MSIRPATAADLPEMQEIYRPFVERTAVSFEYQVPTPEEFPFVSPSTSPNSPGWSGRSRAVFWAMPTPARHGRRAAYRWCAESSVYLAPEARGRGVGKALYQALEDILRRQGYRTLYALVTTDNEASIGFHEAIGFVRRAFFPNCGYKLGTWHGVVWLEKQLAPPDAPTSFPEPWCREEHSI